MQTTTNFKASQIRKGPRELCHKGPRAQRYNPGGKKKMLNMPSGVGSSTPSTQSSAGAVAETHPSRKSKSWA